MPTVSQTGVDAHGGANGSGDVADDAAQLKSDGYTFVAQYIDQDDSVADENNASPSFEQAADGPPGGSLTAAEAQQDLAAGLQIVSIFETNGEAITPYEGAPGGGDNTYPEIVSYLTSDQGETDVAKAIASAKAVGQPTGTAIYFALDFDTGPPGYIAGLQQAVENYLKGVSAGLAGSGYQVGVYGAAQTLQWATTADAANAYAPAVTDTWLSGSTGWEGYGPTPGDAGNTEIVGPNGDTTTHGWTMIQSIPGDNNSDPSTAPGTTLGIDNDTAAASQPFGAWQTQAVPCYCTGTRILTDRGETEVQDLAVGDLVVTTSGAHRPVRWIGHRRVDPAAHRDPRAMHPVRVTAGAFGPGRPTRDLWMSPGHNVLVGDVLMPVRVLVNGVTVTQETVDTVTYWHVELDSHDVILAENLAAETYLDTGNRTAFANGGVFVDVHPDFELSGEAETCAPLVKAGPAVKAVKTALLARAEELGHATTDLHDLHAVADGRRIEPIDLGNRRFAVTLPAGSEAIALVSRHFVPAHVKPDSTDTRRLGVSVRRLQVDGEEIDLRGPLDEGWHAPEQRPDYVRRWTTGSVRLPAGSRLVVVDLVGDGRYWLHRKDDRVALEGPDAPAADEGVGAMPPQNGAGMRPRRAQARGTRQVNGRPTRS